MLGSESIETQNFGCFCPYWTQLDGQVVVADTAEEIFSAVPAENRRVDPVAFFELLEFNYMLGIAPFCRELTEYRGGPRSGGMAPLQGGRR